jgi:exonuclease SbcD
MRLATPDASREFRPGRMYLLNRPFVGAHQTRSGERAQFVLVPYPTTIRYGREGDRPATKEEEHRTLNNRVVEWLNGDAQSKLDPKLPTVLVGHLHITGAGLSHSLYRLTERDDVVFETGVRPAWAQYVALGHIHKQQALAGFADVWYSGSLDRLDFGERDDDKGVVMVEIDETGLRGEPVPLPLPATPMVRVVIDDAADELPTLAERVPDPMSSLVHVTARFRPGGPTRDEITRAVRVTFPRLIELAWERPDPHTADRPTSVCTATDYRATVRDYLSRDVPADDPDRAALLELVETFLTPEAQP